MFCTRKGGRIKFFMTPITWGHSSVARLQRSRSQHGPLSPHLAAGGTIAGGPRARLLQGQGSAGAGACGWAIYLQPHEHLPMPSKPWAPAPVAARCRQPCLLETALCLTDSRQPLRTPGLQTPAAGPLAG